SSVCHSERSEESFPSTNDVRVSSRFVAPLRMTTPDGRPNSRGLEDLMAPDSRPVAGILLFDRVEVLDFAGPYEVLSQAKLDDGARCLRVLTVAARPEIHCNGGLRVLVDSTIDNCPALDLLVIPGGPGADDRTD